MKYIKQENEAYWMYFRDIPPPNQEQETFTVHIPRDNRLSRIAWENVAASIREVTNRKLGVERAPR